MSAAPAATASRRSGLRALRTRRRALRGQARRHRRSAVLPPGQPDGGCPPLGPAGSGGAAHAAPRPCRSPPRGARPPPAVRSARQPRHRSARRRRSSSARSSRGTRSGGATSSSCASCSRRTRTDGCCSSSRRSTGSTSCAAAAVAVAVGALARSTPMGASSASSRARCWPRVLGGFADRRCAARCVGPPTSSGSSSRRLWVNDPHYAGLATETGWPALYDITDDWTEAGDGDRATQSGAGERGAGCSTSAGRSWCAPMASPTSRRRRSCRPRRHPQRRRRRAPHPAEVPPGRSAGRAGGGLRRHPPRGPPRRRSRRAARRRRARAGRGAGRPQLAGRVVDARAWPATQNVHLLGARPYADVPGYLQHADVVIVPHVVSAFTESLDPIKAYECLAVGRPTIATPVAGFRGLGEPVRCVERSRVRRRGAAG